MTIKLNIQEKQVYLHICSYSVDEFLFDWSEDRFYDSENQAPTQEDYDQWLITKACDYAIGTPTPFDLILK